MVVGFACQWSSLLLRPDEVLSGIPDALVLEVAYNALGILSQPHHMRIGGLTSFGFGTDGNRIAPAFLDSRQPVEIAFFVLYRRNVVGVTLAAHVFCGATGAALFYLCRPPLTARCGLQCRMSACVRVC